MSGTNQDLLMSVAEKHGSGEIGTEQMGAILSVLGGGNILTESSGSSNPLNAKTFDNVTDANGDPLVAGKNYLLQGEKVKVLREKFGAGNFMDTYYRVFYLGSDLEERFTVVNVKFSGGPFGSRIYRSKFVPVVD